MALIRENKYMRKNESYWAIPKNQSTIPYFNTVKFKNCWWNFPCWQGAGQKEPALGMWHDRNKPLKHSLSTSTYFKMSQNCGTFKMVSNDSISLSHQLDQHANLSECPCWGVEIDQLFSLVHLRNPTSETIHLLLCLGWLIYITSASGQLSDPRSKRRAWFSADHRPGSHLFSKEFGKFTNFQSVQIANCPRQENWYSLLIQSKLPVVCQPKKSWSWAVFGETQCWDSWIV